MRFERLALAPYGRFENREILFRPDAALHVLFGPNEAGKTTTLSAIADLLFGFEARTDYGFAHGMPNLRVGAALRLADGSVLELRRRKGMKNTLVDAADRAIAEEPLARALGAIDRKIFTSEFGLTAQALRAGGDALLKAGGELAQTLAASSAGLSALSRLGGELAEQADELFTPRKSAGKPFYVALERHDAAHKRLREATISADALREAEQALLDARAREVDLAQQRDEAARALAKFRRAQRTRARLIRLDALAQDLAALRLWPAFDAPARAAATRALAILREGRAELARLADEEAKVAADAEARSVDENLLTQAGAIEALHRQLGAIEKAAADLPRRQEARHAALTALEDLARRLGFADADAMLASPPTDAALGKARAAIDARRRAEERRADALTRSERAAEELARLRALPETAIGDPEPLRRRLETFLDMAAQADALGRERAAIAAETRVLGESAARLGLAPEALETLARTPLPDEAEIAAQARREAAGAQALGGAKAGLETARRDLAAAEADLAGREREGATLTPADLAEARARRDRVLYALGGALDDAAMRRERFEDLRLLVPAADAVADVLLTNGERAGRLQSAREAVAARREALKQAQDGVAAAESAVAAALSDWKELWTPIGVAARAPAEMARWRDRLDALMKQRQGLASRASQAEALAQGVEQARGELHRLVGDFGGSLDAPASFETALREARALAQARDAAWRKAQDVVMARARAESDVLKAQADLARETDALKTCLSDWPAAMMGLSLGAGAGIEEVLAALAVWADVPLHRLTLQREARSVEGIESDLAKFAAEVARLVAALRPDGASERPEQAVLKLHAAMGEARRAAEARAALIRQRDGLVAQRRAAQGRIEAAARDIDAAGVALGVDGEAELQTALDDIERRAEIEGQRRQVRDDLIDVADGLDEAQLRAEQAELDFDLIAGAIDALDAQLARNLSDIGAAAVATREAERRLADISRGRDAAGAARDRVEAGGELADVAERWFLRQAAAKLAARVIERHRATTQDPVMSQAGHYFSLATGGAFSGLGADYDEADRPALQAIRAGGGRVDVAGLSEGARDQLFLALRLALLERRSGEPLPFIGDDILASFDDERTRATLALLADYGRRRQAILFTHHRHVADLARAAGADVIDL